MPEPISMPQLAAVPSGAGAGTSSAADQRAEEASPFDAMLQAGLARREDSGAQKAPERTPADSGPAKEGAGSGDAPRAKIDADPDSDPLVALLAYGAADITAALLASAPGDPAAAAAVFAASANPARIPDQGTQAAAPTGAPLRAGGTAATDALLDPQSLAGVATTSARPASAPGERSPGDPDAISNRFADAVTDPAAAAQVLAKDARPATDAPLRPVAAEVAAAGAAAGASTASTPAPETRARRPGTAATDDAAPARRGRPVAADASGRPADENRPKEERVAERPVDARGSAATPAPVQRSDDRLAHLVKSQDAKAVDRPLEVSPRADAVARTDGVPQADAAQAPAAALAPAAAARPTSVPVIQIEPRVGSSHWNQDFVSQVNLLVSHREPQAEIRVNPPHLGPVEVRIGLDGNQVSVTFTSAHAETRSAIENALPQLREMFSDNGLALGNASVSAESSQQQSPRSEGSAASRFAPEDLAEVDVAMPIRAAITRLVDTFA